MSQSLIQAQVAYGYAQAARILGAPAPWYRPNGNGPVLVAGNSLGTLQVLLDTKADMSQTMPENFGKASDWFGGFDATNVLPGDYFVAAHDSSVGKTPFFVAGLNWFRPARLVQCKRIVTVSRPGSQSPGPGYYGGDLTSTETVLVTGWPVAITDKGRRQAGETKLPGDMDLPWEEILLPPSFPVQIESMDILLDDQTQPVRYVVSAVEQTTLGWRLMARAAVP